MRIYFLVTMTLLSGCSYKITYNTEPTGASIICDDVNKGYSPVTLNYSLSEENKGAGIMNTVPCTAIWSSGTRKEFTSTWDLKKFPNGVMQTLQHPRNRFYAEDAEFSFRVAKLKNYYSITFDSNPQGATLICGGKNRGYTPKTIRYNSSMRKHATIDISYCSAHWVSGVSKEYSEINTFTNGGTLVTLQRPKGEGFSQDAEFAFKVKSMQIQRRQAQQTLEYQKRQAQAAEDSAYEAKRRNNKVTNCYTLYGQTTCY